MRETSERPTDHFVPDMPNDDGDTIPVEARRPIDAHDAPKTDEVEMPLTELPESPKFREDGAYVYERALEALRHFLKTMDPENEMVLGGTASLVLEQLEDYANGIAMDDQDAIVAHGLGTVLDLPPKKIGELLRDPRLRDDLGEELVQAAE